VKIITGCSSVCIRHCGKMLIGNNESILDFYVYSNVGSGSNELRFGIVEGFHCVY
jgi:hypothetical protein